LMNRTEMSWAQKKVAGVLLMDTKAAFNNVSKHLLLARLGELNVEKDLIRWVGSFMADRQVRLALDGDLGDTHKVETGIPQGSPAAPILFVVYISAIFQEVEKTCQVRGLSFADDVAWWAEGRNDREVAERLSKASKAACSWAGSNGGYFDHQKTEALFLSQRRRGPTATIESDGRQVPFNKKATRWLGVWLDSQLTLKEHQKTMLKKGRKAFAQVRRLTGQLGLTPSNCRKVMTACVQSVAMYGSELWWKVLKDIRVTDGAKAQLGGDDNSRY
jgi:hypothetical protein